MSYARILNRTWTEHLLHSVLLELTYRCNLNCVVCYNDRELQETPLVTGQYQGLFEDLRDLGTFDLTFSGGEPLLHPAFFQLGARARSLGFVVRVKTNGHALGQRLVRRLKDEIDPFVVEVSLHGATAASHDRQTRTAGSFERLLGHLRNMREVGLRVRLKSPLTAWNEQEIEDMFELADRLGLPLDVDPQLTPRDDGDRAPLAIASSADGRRRLFARFAERGRAHSDAREQTLRQAAPVPDVPPVPSPHCGAGSANVVIDPFGNVYPCVQWRRPLGNLHRQSIREIWTASPALAEVRQLGAQVKTWLDGHDTQARAIGFCPGLAEQMTGSPLCLYPSVQHDLVALNQLKPESRVL